MTKGNRMGRTLIPPEDWSIFRSLLCRGGRRVIQFGVYGIYYWSLPAYAWYPPDIVVILLKHAIDTDDPVGIVGHIRLEIPPHLEIVDPTELIARETEAGNIKKIAGRGSRYRLINKRTGAEFMTEIRLSPYDDYAQFTLYMVTDDQSRKIMTPN